MSSREVSLDEGMAEMGERKESAMIAVNVAVEKYILMQYLCSESRNRNILSGKMMGNKKQELSFRIFTYF